MKKLCEEDLRKVVWLSDPALSPDGKTAVYVRAQSDYKTGKNVPVLMEISIASGEQKPVSRLTKRQTAPRFSPDGAFLAFCSDDRKVNRLYVKNLQTGEEEQLTLSGVTDYAWSPDGKSLAVCVPSYYDRKGNQMPVTNEEEAAAWRQEMDHAPRYTEKLMYKLDEAFGFLDGSITAISLIDVESGASRPILNGDFPCSLPSFSADGKKLYYYGQPCGREKALTQKIFQYDLKTGAHREIPAVHSVQAAMPVLEKDGLPVYAGYSEENSRTELFAIDEPNEKELPLLPAGATEGIDPAIIGDDRNGQMGYPVRQDGQGLPYFLTAEAGRMFVADGQGREILSGGCVQAFSAPVHDQMVFLRSYPHHPGELFWKNIRTGEEKRLTCENDWIEEYDTVIPEKIALSEEDHTVRGWVLLPEGDESCPAVLYVHGGPECFYGEDIFFFEALSLRAAGFAVLWCNPRGSAGYGKEFTAGAYGREAMDDLLHFVDACGEKHPRIELSRLGVTGGSYGGYMTNKLTMHTDRFKAAAAQRTWIDPATSYGTGDMGFLSGSGKTDFRAYMLNRAKVGILKDIRKLNTPTLLLHGEKDVRCGEEQADQVFNMIKALRPGVPCRLVVFPGENHSLTRTGLMHNRIRHMLEIRRWMEKYLNGREATP